MNVPVLGSFLLWGEAWRLGLFFLCPSFPGPSRVSLTLGMMTGPSHMHLPPSGQVVKPGLNCSRAAGKLHLCTHLPCKNPCTLQLTQLGGLELFSVHPVIPARAHTLHPRPVVRWARDRVVKSSQIA